MVSQSGDGWEAEVLRARDERLAKLRGQEALVQEVSAILFAADPIGINDEENTDEYDPEAQSIVLRLPTVTSVLDLQVVCHEEFTRWFSADQAGPLERYASIARDIWAAAARAGEGGLGRV